jgi:hypothetical protein
VTNELPKPAARGFAVDRTGVAMIFAFAVVITPALMLAATWLLTDGFSPSGASTFSLISAVLVGLLGVYLIYVALRELGGAVGVRIDERGVGKGKLELGWDEIESLEAPAFGLLVIHGKGQSLRLRTYLYDDRIALLEYIARRSGQRVPELGYSF